MKTAIDLLQELDYAKNALQAKLDNAKCSVDFHGISYWATQVERLQKELKELTT